jgi:dihydropteroate synthase
MGILNATPDSFYAQSRVTSSDQILEQASKMIAEGASILDIGGFSSRPGASNVSVQEEVDRVIPVVDLLHQHFPKTILSVDTFRSEVARYALQSGAHLINDISAFNVDDSILDVVAQEQVPYVLMHMQGVPQSMQKAPQYEDVLVEIMDFFVVKVAMLRSKGIKDIVLDVGFGFGKTIEHNYQLLKNLGIYQQLDLPMMAGVSRKSMIWKTLNIHQDDALNGSTALHMVALQQGASILRVHDVKEAQEVVQLWQKLSKQA